MREPITVRPDSRRLRAWQAVHHRGVYLREAGIGAIGALVTAIVLAIATEGTGIRDAAIASAVAVAVFLAGLFTEWFRKYRAIPLEELTTENNGLLMRVAALEQELQDAKLSLKTEQQRRDFVNALVDIKKEGLHNRNMFGNESKNPNALPAYRAFEQRWHQQIRGTMEQFGCPSSDISRVSDLTENEIMAHAPQEPKVIHVQSESYEYNRRWLIGLLELRVQRLQEIIDKYNPD
jgi:hypothetical protein